MRKMMMLMIVFPIIASVLIYGVRNFSGEVATLYTTDSSGRTFTTQLWIVDEGHKVWVRSLRPTSPWLDRLIDHPDVKLQRGDVLTEYRAAPVTHRRSRVNALIASRYGWGDWLLSKIEDRSEAVPIYLDPFG
jgi:hypothetical protein